MRKIEFPSMERVAFRQFAPSAALAGVVQSIWTVGGGSSPSNAPSFDERTFPDGCVTLMFSYGEGIRIDGRTVGAPGFVESTVSGPMRLTVSSRAPTVGVRLYPGGLHALFGGDAHPLIDSVVPLPELLPAGPASIYDQLGELCSPAARAAAIDRWCRERLATQAGLSVTVRRARDALLGAQGRLELAALAASLGLGSRQLERRFRHEIGLSPRTLARVTRVAHARTLLDRARPGATAAVAQLAGYYDQAHFTHEFKRVTGLTPAAYRQRLGQ